MDTKFSNGSTPVWVNQFASKFQDGVNHAFVLHFNVKDYVVPGISLRTYLGRLFANRKVIVFYNRAEGLRFPLEAHRKEFIRLLDLETPAGQAEAKMAGLGDTGPNRNDPKVALTLLTRLLRMGTPAEAVAAVVIEYADTLFPEGGSTPDDRTNLVMALGWGTDPDIQASGNAVFLVTENLTDLNSSLRAASSRVEALELPLPDYDHRLAFIRWYLAQEHMTTLHREIEPEQLASLTSLLSYLHIEDIFLRALGEGALTAEMARDRKREIISSEFAQVLDIWDPRYSYQDIGGLAHVKRFFQNSVIKPIQEGNLKRVPMGVLLMGPAGTGKSIMAEAIAFEAGINAVQLNLSRIFDQYVGNSERNMERALKAIEYLSPCIVFIDEIDQALSRGESGDSGVSNRLFKRIMEFMADGKHRGKIVFLAATNRPDLMDAALRRPGRFDKKIAFLIPNEIERVELFQIFARRQGFGEVEVSREVILATDGWTGAEIEVAAVKATELSEDEGLTPGAAFLEAVKRMVPSTADIEYMTSIALAETNDLDLLPEEYRLALKDRKALQTKIENSRPDEFRKRRI